MKLTQLWRHLVPVLAMSTGAGALGQAPQPRQPGEQVVSADDGPRAGVTYEAIAGLNPVFRPDGVVTAGNCCPLNDGAAAVVIMSDTRAKELGIKNIRVNQSGCLDRCELGPNVLIQPEGIWYQIRTKADVDEILQKHIIDGGRVERLMLEPTDKLPKDVEARRTKTAAE